MYPSGSTSARIYGTPKMRKFSPSGTFPKLRPIVSSIGTFNYDLARFVCNLLSPVVPDDYSCKNTFNVVSQIKNANISSKFLVSYDVASRFTNIPLQENINIAINLIFNHIPTLNITKKNFKNFSFLLHHRIIFLRQLGPIIKHCKVPKYYDQYCLKNFLLFSILPAMIELSGKSAHFAQIKIFLSKTTNKES